MSPRICRWRSARGQAPSSRSHLFCRGLSACGLNVTAKESEFFPSGRTRGCRGQGGRRADRVPSSYGMRTGRHGRVQADARVPDKDSVVRGRVLRPPGSRALPCKDAGPSGAMSPGHQKGFRCLILTLHLSLSPQERNTDTPCKL